ncbi:MULTISPECIES: hypothetical protein [Deinococcus]|uniref:hypothetical protein n=1 Tax=Deinococcus TaxID=1298 RepID=UPI001404F484|nr:MULTISPECIES: hypothetical protein [Deinococcus]
MPFQKIVKLVVMAMLLGFPVAWAGVGSTGASGAGVSNHGIAHSTSPVSPQGANDYGIA